MIGFLFATVVLLQGFLTVTESCNTRIIAGNDPVNITSPNYPRPYPNYTNCWWVITPADENRQLVLTVVDSELDPSIFHNWIKIFDGYDTTGDERARLMGNQTGEYVSTQNAFYVQFEDSVRNNTNRGFLIQVYQLPGCGGQLVARSLTSYIPSPGFPNTYPNDLNCVWTLTTEFENDTVEIEVIRSDIEDTPECTADFISVYYGDDNRFADQDTLGKFCGSDAPTLQSPGSQMMVVFRSDSSYSGSGFLIKYKSLEATNCNRTLKGAKTDLFLVSPGYPNGMLSDMECVWAILTDLTNVLQLQFVSTDVEDSDNCTDNAITVYEGGYNGNELESFCGNSTPYYMSGVPIMMVTFRTGQDPIGAGFRMSYKTIIPPTPKPTSDPRCGPSGLIANTTSQYLQSPGYPITYMDNEDCYWTITSSNNTMVRVTVLDSELETNDDCSYDYVEVFDGSSIQSSELTIWCGDTLPIFQSSGNSLTLHFHSDSSNHYKGFQLTYYETRVPYTCGGSLTATTDGHTLLSPGYVYPGHYSDNMDCVWLIGTVSTNIKLEVLDSNIEYESDCPYDHASIYDGSSTSSPLIGKFCGTSTPTYLSSRNYVTVRFQSDSSSNYKGFKLRYTGGDFSPCGEKDLVSSIFIDYIKSPNYPLDYPINADCTWRIDTQDTDYVVSIDVMSFNLEYSDGCQYDYVEAFDGYDDSAPSLGKWCGVSGPNKQSSGQYMFIRFKTDGSNTDTGFKISYSSEFDDGYIGTNVGAIVGGTIGGTFFMIFVIVLIAVGTGRRNRPTVTRVRDTPAQGNIYNVVQGPYETTVTPAAFQPPPAYCQVATGEQSRLIGVAAPPPYGQAVPANAAQNKPTEAGPQQTPATIAQRTTAAPAAHAPSLANNTTQAPFPQQGVTSETARIVNQ